MEKNDIWFPAKKYGVGWGLPITWQGWFVLILYLLITIGGSIATVKFSGNEILFLPFVLIMTILLVFICYKKGEKIK